MTSTTATFQFIKWQETYKTQKPYEILLPLPAGSEDKVPRSNLVFESHRVPVYDVCNDVGSFTLDTHGFEFVKHTASVKNFKEPENISGKNGYVKEMEEWIKSHLKLRSDAKVLCFDFRIRESINPDEFSKRTVNLEDGFDPLLPATHPHVDQSMKGAILRVKRHMGDEADELLRGRVRVINIWRPLDKVRSWPLALCDARTVRDEDLVTCDIVRRRYVGETLFSKHAPEQMWYYLSNMDKNDVALIKVYDSDSKVEAKRCVHASFELNDDRSLPPRESIELRALVFTKSK
ncbi:hypothetical protein QBC38DRAFT_484888 [Podospora fimiseda]|uniref:Methyltransferase n=1 Tax=Podospora fimiseda TaxID=252190 RepID=A0AAN7BJY2_9PEZI|nr:hypothetical protein QBC38DRAFT_484888 [Podospora fimiseda]